MANQLPYGGRGEWLPMDTFERTHPLQVGDVITICGKGRCYETVVSKIDTRSRLFLAQATGHIRRGQILDG